MVPESNQGPANGSLDSWKEIAVYLGRDVSTVQRWEHSRGLPVRRIQGGKRGAVYALKSELDAWKYQDGRGRGTGENCSPDHSPSRSPLPFHRPTLLWTAAAAAATALLFALVFLGARRSEAPLRFVPLASLPGEELDPALSPDGGGVAFSYREGPGALDLYVKRVGAGEPLRLTQTPEDELFPQWSPDSSRIAFFRDPGREIWIIGATGGGQRKVGTVQSHRGIGPLAWSAAGDTLFLADAEDSRRTTSLYALHLATGSKTRLTFPPRDIPGDAHPALSPDGRWLAFTRQDLFMVKEVWVMRRTGGPPRRITSDRRNIAGLAWLDNGNLLFISDRGGPGPAIWKVAAAGGSPRLVAYLPPYARGLSVSSPARRIAYVQLTVRSSIWRYALASGQNDPERLITSSAVQAHPQYSPDGNSIAFMSDRSGFMEIWVARGDGANPRQLTDLHGMGGAPRWSPDGRRIAFDMRVDGNHGIFVVGADGGPVARLVADSFENGSPSWSRDGNWIYFLSNRSGAHQVWKIAAAGGSPSQVTRDGGHIPFESPDGKVLYFAKGPPELGIWRKTLPGGEETPLLPGFSGAPAGAWQVASNGICFIDTSSPGAPSLKLLPFGPGEAKVLATFRGVEYPARFPGGVISVHPISVSPDHRFVLLTRLDHRQGNIMISELHP
ncbi:MAG: PD40 domain-containing protein [Acidobacteria bacterium]|nr:PD40 domain-containing protein [Acidobacteriota bacterium]